MLNVKHVHVNELRPSTMSLNAGCLQSCDQAGPICYFFLKYTFKETTNCIRGMLTVNKLHLLYSVHLLQLPLPASPVAQTIFNLSLSNLHTSLLSESEHSVEVIQNFESLGKTVFITMCLWALFMQSIYILWFTLCLYFQLSR